MKLSIITINYNNLEGLKKTFASVVNQTFTDYEWIVIDGGSTDGSKELIERYSDKFSFWCSEPDGGVYNAMNKGILKAKGEYINFMNSGDSYHSNETLFDVFSNEITSDVIYGDVVYVYPNRDIHKVACNPLTLKHLYTSTIFHQSSFIKTSLLLECGYDESLKIVSDWKKWIEFMLQNRSFKYVNVIVADMDSDGISLNNAELRDEERIKVLNELVSKGISCSFEEIDKYERIIGYNPEISIVYKYLIKRRLYKRLINLFLKVLSVIEKILS